MLQADNVHVSYGRFEVLKGVSIRVDNDETISVIGANGAGKSTLVKAITAFLPCREGKIIYGGIEVMGFSAEKLVGMGMVHVFEGRRVFGLSALLITCFSAAIVASEGMKRNKFRKTWDMFSIFFRS
jgi:branched-chain amino acid transport system ATP-binding protein